VPFLELHVGVADPVDLGDLVPDLVRLAADEAEVGAEDTHDDRLARAGENLVDALVQVRLDVREHARELRHRVLDLRPRRLVRGPSDPWRSSSRRS
jgi:hypothetical protein